MPIVHHQSIFFTASVLLALLLATEKTALHFQVSAFTTTTAFTKSLTTTSSSTSKRSSSLPQQWHLSLSDTSSAAEAETTAEESAFVPLEVNEEQEDKEEDGGEVELDVVEKMGSPKAKKKKRGRRKAKQASSSAQAKVKKTLTPEEVFYEGPPAITETLAPTASILTVVGIIPAAAAWARQAWVRYKITDRRIRVNSGVGGKEMAEIVYPDIVEIRTVKRLFGDGDMVAFLRDGAKFEMRNIPNFEEAMEFMLKQVDPKVVAEYRNKGDVTRPPE